MNISFLQQCRSLTRIRAEMPEHRALIQRGQNMTRKRLDRAFAAFFRRVKAGQTPGFPRYKSARRFGGWSLCADEGYRYLPKLSKAGKWFNGKSRLSGIGMVKARGKARNAATQVKQCDLLWRQGRWFASLCCESAPVRACGKRFAGLDWSVNDFATLAYADGAYETIANDRLFVAQQQKAAARQKKASCSLRGNRSRRAAAKHLSIARAHAKLANQRKDCCHKASAKLVACCRFIATETLQVANMTWSARGTADNPGKQVAQKAGLNREILDTAPSLLVQQIRTKAAEAGCAFVEVNTRRTKPSQTCPQCDEQVKKRLSERQHVCSCGFTATRDQAAALVILKRALENYGRKPAGGDAPENPIQSRKAAWVG